MASTTIKENEIPSLMRAAQQTNFGNVREVLTLSDNVPVPRQLSATQILIRAHAASFNPADWKILYGNLSFVVRYSWPHIPGSDVAGVVVDVGSAVKRFRVGDHVYGNVGMKAGAFAEYVRSEESYFALKPTNLTMQEAAGVPLACDTAYQVLFRTASPPVTKGTKLFICGGSTACGLFAIQLAKAVGASVVTTASQRNLELLKRLGYQIVQKKSDFKNDEQQILVIDYNQQDFGEELNGENFDLVCDCVGGVQQWIAAQKILKHHGQFITLVGDDTRSVVTFKAVLNIGGSIINRKFWSIFGSAHLRYGMHSSGDSTGVLDDIRTNYIETNKLKPLIDTVFDWKEQGVDALYLPYEKSKSGKAQGKLILKIAPEP